MNDDELITLMRESFTVVHTTTPIEQIVSRGRAVRTRRRIPAVAGGLVVVAGAAIAATSLNPGTRQPGNRPIPAQLAAWTVTKQADGAIRVTIRELRDPAGLQSKLRADGVPASVTLIGRQNQSCHRYPSTGALLKMIVSHTFEAVPPQRLAPPANNPLTTVNLAVVLTIHPSALPSGTGVQLATTFTLLPPVVAHGSVEHVAHLGLQQALVYASPACTG
jgi:hypothetical protein